MITIHKYQFELANEFEIEMHKKARILDVQLQGEDNKPTMWAMVNTEWPMEKRKFKAYWTGEELNGLDLFRTHIATIQDIYIWHIFE